MKLFSSLNRNFFSIMTSHLLCLAFWFLECRIIAWTTARFTNEVCCSLGLDELDGGYSDPTTARAKRPARRLQPIQSLSIDQPPTNVSWFSMIDTARLHTTACFLLGSSFVLTISVTTRFQVALRSNVFLATLIRLATSSAKNWPGVTAI